MDLCAQAIENHISAMNVYIHFQFLQFPSFALMAAFASLILTFMWNYIEFIPGWIILIFPV